jgi:hypothetical protein
VEAAEEWSPAVGVARSVARQGMGEALCRGDSRRVCVRKGAGVVVS